MIGTFADGRLGHSFHPEKFLKIFQKIEGREPANLFAKDSFSSQRGQKVHRIFGGTFFVADKQGGGKLLLFFLFSPVMFYCVYSVRVFEKFV